MAQATSNKEAASSKLVEHLLQQQISHTDSMWPVDLFLRGELYRLRGETNKALDSYRKLAIWGANNPYRDGRGGSGLSMIALWRWVEIVRQEDPKNSRVKDSDEVTSILKCGEILRRTTFTRGLFSQPLLATLPQAEEQSVRLMAQLAWLDGRKDEGEELFLQYLDLARTKERDPTENQMWQDLLATKQASEDRLKLQVALRLATLGQDDPDTMGQLQEILDSNEADVRAQAGLQLAILTRLRGNSRKSVQLLTTALQAAGDPRLQQQILLERAHRYRSLGQQDKYVDDLNLLIADFPNGNLSDEALYELANHFESIDQPGQALEYFGRIRDLQRDNQWFDLSHLDAALTLYTRGEPGDISAAIDLLKNLAQRPESYGHFASLFWLGKLNEELGNGQRARGYFEQVITEAPFDYYSVRARMHLNTGANARSMLLPDQKTMDQIGAGYDPGGKITDVPADSPYSRRLQTALDSGLYRQSLDAFEQLRQMYPSSRLETLDETQLSNSGMFSRVGLLLAFREDAEVAVDLQPLSRLQVASAVGKLSTDWPRAIELCNRRSEPQSPNNDSQAIALLNAAYPSLYVNALKSAANATKVLPDLLYSVVRRESAFYPSALSSDGALGLFQFIPTTFNELDRKWNLLRCTGINTPQEYLLNPALNINLGAHWFAYNLHKFDGNIIASVIAHNSTYGTVSNWQSILKTSSRLNNDVEYSIEAIPLLEIKRFVRGVIGDMAVSLSAGIVRGISDSPTLSTASTQQGCW